MKKKALLITAVLMMFTVASLAVDAPPFDIDYATGGIDYAVAQQLIVGTSPNEIINDAMLVEGIDKRDIIEALQRADVQVNILDTVGVGAVSQSK